MRKELWMVCLGLGCVTLLSAQIPSIKTDSIQPNPFSKNWIKQFHNKTDPSYAVGTDRLFFKGREEVPSIGNLATMPIYIPDETLYPIKVVKPDTIVRQYMRNLADENQ